MLRRSGRGGAEGSTTGAAQFSLDIEEVPALGVDVVEQRRREMGGSIVANVGCAAEVIEGVGHVGPVLGFVSPAAKYDRSPGV